MTFSKSRTSSSVAMSKDFSVCQSELIDVSFLVGFAECGVFRTTKFKHDFGIRPSGFPSFGRLNLFYSSTPLAACWISAVRLGLSRLALAKDMLTPFGEPFGGSIGSGYVGLACLYFCMIIVYLFIWEKPCRPNPTFR